MIEGGAACLVPSCGHSIPAAIRDEGAALLVKSTAVELGHAIRHGATNQRSNRLLVMLNRYSDTRKLGPEVLEHVMEFVKDESITISVDVMFGFAVALCDY